MFIFQGSPKITIASYINIKQKKKKSKERRDYYSKNLSKFNISLYSAVIEIETC